MPIRGLYELTRLVGLLKGKLKDITCPVTLIQSTGDHVVDPVSATIAYDLIRTEDKTIHWIESERHGILNENVGDTHALLLEFVGRCAKKHAEQLRGADSFSG